LAHADFQKGRLVRPNHTDCAAVYVGEHSPDRKRGFYTSFIQITGLCVSLLVMLGTQSEMSKENFTDWGWRIPFLLFQRPH